MNGRAKKKLYYFKRNEMLHYNSTLSHLKQGQADKTKNSQKRPAHKSSPSKDSQVGGQEHLGIFRSAAAAAAAQGWCSGPPGLFLRSLKVGGLIERNGQRNGVWYLLLCPRYLRTAKSWGGGLGVFRAFVKWHSWDCAMGCHGVCKVSFDFPLGMEESTVCRLYIYSAVCKSNGMDLFLFNQLGHK